MLHLVYFYQFDDKSSSSHFMHIIIFIESQNQRRIALVSSRYGFIVNERPCVKGLIFYGISRLTSPLEPLKKNNVNYFH